MPRRSSRRTSASVAGAANDDVSDEEEAVMSSRRVSSRSNKFASSMKEPTHTLDDILAPATPDGKSKSRGGGGRAAKKRHTGTSKTNDDDDDDDESDVEMAESSSSSSSSSEEDSEEEEVVQPTRSSTRTRSGRGSSAAPKSPKIPKSPAVRHRTRRRTVRTEIPIEQSDLDEEESDDDAVSTSDEGSADEAEEESDIKIQRIIATRSETRRKWKELCGKINTSEIDNGSRWFQDDDEDGQQGRPDDTNDEGEVVAAPSANADADDRIFEERFLVKWSGLSFLHCSWERQDDLIAQVENAKTYLTTFFRKSENGLLFDADERGDGEFFDPSFVQIERILEIIQPEVADEEDEDDAISPKSRTKSVRSDEDDTTSGGERSPVERYGMVLDKDDPEFENGVGRQFLVKWGNTAYADCSYEFERDLILNDVEYEEHVKDFLCRSKKPTKTEMSGVFKKQEEQRRRLYKIFGERAKGSQKDKDAKISDYQKNLERHIFANGGQVRDYQAEGISWMMANYINKRSSILADEMGLGKTIQTAVYVNTLATEIGMRGPFLIVAPLSTIPHWHREFSGWTKLNTIVYHGSAKDREYIREFEMAYESDRPHNLGFNSQFLRKCHKRTAPKWEKTWMVDVVITTPEMLVTDDYSELTSVKWDALVVDEAHRLKNHASKLANNLRDNRFDFGTTLLLTGTPIQNNMQEMWTLLNIVDPDNFDHLDGFLERYGDIKSKERVDELHETIRPYILRRLKEDVEKSVPPKEETLIEVELTVLQKQYYRALYEKNVQFLHRNQKKALDGPSINNLAIQLRKCCNHPFLLRGVEEEVRVAETVADNKTAEADFLVKASGKLVLLDKLLPKLKEDGHRVLIFSQFKIMLDILEDYLELRGMKHERIDGSITGKKRQMAIDRFQAKETEGKETSFVMLLSTRAGGVGINLTAADTCIIFDSDWNPQNDLQAQARCHRIGQTKSVKVYRLLTRKTYEIQMFHQSSLKMGLDQAVLQGIEGGSAEGEGVLTKEEVERLLRHGAYDIFNEEKSGTSEQESKDFESQDIDLILARRAKTVVHENTGSKSSAAGGTFSKASFKAQKNEGGGSGEGNEDIDIDDPEFWKKMVGEAQIDDSDNLHGKKRKRKEANYSEKEYDKNLRRNLLLNPNDADKSDSDDDDSSVSSSGSDSDASSGDEIDYELGQGELLNDSLVALREVKKAATQKREKHRWGGSGKDAWPKADCEALLGRLQSSGYGNIPWEDFFGKIEFKKASGYSDEEMRRMCWSLALFAFRELVDEDARETVRRAVRAAEKKRESEDGATAAAVTSTSDDGGILGNAKEPTEEEKEEEKRRLDQIFNKQWQQHAVWASKALEDAVAYVKAHPPRKEVAVQELLDARSHGDKVVQKPLPSLTVAFNDSIWPSLQSRNWKEEVVIDEKPRHPAAAAPKRYVYKGKTYKNIGAVLDAIPVLHPELVNTVDSIILSVKNEISASRADDDKESASILDKVSSLDSSTVTAESLSILLKHFAPSQLLTDRVKENTRVRTGRRLVILLSYLSAAHSLVKRSKPNEDGSSESELTDKEAIQRLAKLISLDKRTALPHPNWTRIHDAVLIAAIAKHGWIDRESARKAITEDKAITWGRPFDDGDMHLEEGEVDEDVEREKSIEHTAGSERTDEELISELKVVAKRAAAFFNSEGTIIGEMKGFNKDLVIQNYGLVKVQEDGVEDQAPPTSGWQVDESLLLASTSTEASPKEDAKDSNEGKIPDELSDLPSRKELMKRAKSILTRIANTPTDVNSLEVEPMKQQEKSETKELDHGFCVLDQSNRRNIFLAELLRGLTKTSLNKGTGPKIAKKLISNAVKEADALIENCADNSAKAEGGVKEKTKSDDIVSNELGDMKKIKSHLELVKKTMMKHHRQGKNVIRVIIGVDPIAPKNSSDSLFPVLPKYGTIPASGSSLSKQKQSKPTKAKSKSIKKDDKSDKAEKVSKRRKKKRLEHLDSAIGDVAINQALSIGMEMDKKGGLELPPNSLKLSSIETLILSVVCSQGLPAFLSCWKSLVDPSIANADMESLPGYEFIINWYRMGGVIVNAANVWADIARTNYEQKQLLLARNSSNLSDQQREDLRNEVRQLEADLRKKESAAREAENLCSSAHNLAKRSIMMLAALTENMGDIETRSKKPYNELEKGLGTKVLRWCCDEVKAWATALDIVEKGSPIATVAYNFEPGGGVAAVFDKRACRDVFIQIAQQTKLRSLFIKNGLGKIGNERIPHAVTLSESCGDDWDYCPSWWQCDAAKVGSHMPCPDDTDLIAGILDYGYSGFDEMIRQTERFRSRCTDEEKKEKDDDTCPFSRATIQQRINHLTRELHELDEAADTQSLISQRKVSAAQATVTKKEGGSVQKGINAFFVAKGGKDSPSKKQSNAQKNDDDDIVEIIEHEDESIGGNSKRKVNDDISGNSNSPEKKMKVGDLNQ